MYAPPESKKWHDPRCHLNERLSKRVDAEIDDGSGSEFVFHLPDALGSTRDVVDSSGNVIRSNEWDEYGNLISSWSSGTGAATPKTWIGGLSVNDDTADSGLWNMGHRNYAGGVLGRFISRDPIGFNGSSMNLYAYPSDPVNAVDPSGLQTYADEIVDTRKSNARIDLYRRLLAYAFQLQRKTGYRQRLLKDGGSVLEPCGDGNLNSLKAYCNLLGTTASKCQEANMDTDDFVNIMLALSVSESSLKSFRKSGGGLVNSTGLQGPNYPVMFPQSGFPASLQDLSDPGPAADQTHHLSYFIGVGYHGRQGVRSRIGPRVADFFSNQPDVDLGTIGTAYGSAIPQNVPMKNWNWKIWLTTLCERVKRG